MDPNPLIASARHETKEGDAFVYSGNLGGAKVAYGAAIDAYLTVRLFDDAIEVCRRLIRIAPDVVRARYTLAFLLVGLRRFEEAELALGDYADSVARTHTESFAVPRLALLAYATDHAATRARIAGVLRDFGASAVAERVLEEGASAGAETAEGGTEPARRWERLLEIALQT